MNHTLINSNAILQKSLVGALVIASTMLSGCSWIFGDTFRDRSDDYRRATLEKPLEVPAGFSRDAIEDQLVVPRARTQVALEGEFEVPMPEAINPAAAAERVKLQKLGNQNWILVESAPGEVWPRVRQFLTTNQLGVVRADANAGVIETGWLQPASAAGRERYRFRIEQGVQRGSSEVYIVQADDTAGESAWPTASSNPAREEGMLKALAQFVADNGSSGAVSMLAQQGINAQGKVFIERQTGQPLRLRLALPSDRAWASLEAALPKAGFAVDETNLTERQLLVRYDPVQTDEEKVGFFTSIWNSVFGNDEDDVLSDRKSVYTITLQKGSGADNQLIDIAPQNGGELKPSAREKLLNLIKSNLS